MAYLRLEIQTQHRLPSIIPYTKKIILTYLTWNHTFYKYVIFSHCLYHIIFSIYLDLFKLSIKFVHATKTTQLSFEFKLDLNYLKIDFFIFEMLSHVYYLKIWFDTDSWVQSAVVITYVGRNGYLWAQPVIAAMICCTWRKRDKNRISRLYNGQDNCVWEPVWFRNLSRKVGYTHTKTRKVVYMVRLFFGNNMLYLSFSGSLT